MKRTTLMAVLVLVLLAGCMSGSRVTDFSSGSEGIVISFESNTPPVEVYEYSVVPLHLRLSNKGAFDVPYEHLFFTLLGDSFYVEVTQDPLLQDFDLQQGAEWPNEDPQRQDYDYASDAILRGKQLGYPTGDNVDLRPIVDVREIPGLRENPSVQLYASVCYPYQTTLATSLCVDANAFNGNEQLQVCSAETLTFKDQGAPVAVTMIENRPSPVRVTSEGGRGFLNIVQPTFIFHIENLGTGAVLAATPDREQLASYCAMDIPDEELNAVRVEAKLSRLNLTCNPAVVVLRDGEGYTTCTLLPEDGMVIDAPNYVGALKVTLDYLYREAAAVDLSIIRRPEGFLEGSFTNLERDAHPGFVNGESRCEFCSRTPDAKECAGWPEEAAPGTYSCSCNERQCLSGARDDPATCVYGSTWCAGTNYCCKS
jgi:hypothetical protein